MDKPGRYLIVGSDGLIGKSLSRYFVQTGSSVLETTRRSETISKERIYLDLSKDPGNWDYPPDISVAFICAGITSLKTCREKLALSRIVNVTNTVKLARRLMQNEIRIIYLSTNLVFDGNVPHSRIDQPVSPKTEYGKQKVEAEKILLSEGDLVTILRLTKIIDSQKRLFSDWVQDLRSNDSIYPISGKCFSPLPIDYVLKVVNYLSVQGRQGIVQISGERDVTYEDVGYYIADYIGVSRDRVSPVPANGNSVDMETMPIHTTLDISGTVYESGISAPVVWTTIKQMVHQIVSDAKD